MAEVAKCLDAFMVSVPEVARCSHMAELAQCLDAQAFRKANSARQLAV